MKKWAALYIIMAWTLLLFNPAWAEKSDQKKKKEGPSEAKIVAKVGKDVLTEEGLEKKMQALPPQYQKMIKQNPQFRKNFIDRWVQVSLLAQEARAQKLDTDKAVIQKTEEMANTILAQELITRQVLSKVTVTDEEVGKYYNEHTSEFQDPEMVNARHVLIKVLPDAKPEAWTEAEAKAQAIKKRIDAGEDFAAIAEKESDDPGSKEKGGDLGFFPRGQMVPEFETSAFSLGVGQISDPVKSQFGYHIIKVEGKKEPKPKKLEEVSARIKSRLTEERQEKAVNKFLEDLKTKYSVTINS